MSRFVAIEFHQSDYVPNEPANEYLDWVTDIVEMEVAAYFLPPWVLLVRQFRRILPGQ